MDICSLKSLVSKFVNPKSHVLRSFCHWNCHRFWASQNFYGLRLTLGTKSRAARAARARRFVPNLHLARWLGLCNFSEGQGKHRKQGPHGLSKLKASKFQWKFLFCIWNVGNDEFSSGIQRWFLQFPNGPPWKSWSWWIGVSRISHISIATFSWWTCWGWAGELATQGRHHAGAAFQTGQGDMLTSVATCAQVHHISVCPSI